MSSAICVPSVLSSIGGGVWSGVEECGMKVLECMCCGAVVFHDPLVMVRVGGGCFMTVEEGEEVECGEGEVLWGCSCV